ncbi:transglycosylase domain-containing protein [Paeniglutamicibacter antarcticus]|uniref:Transglycosylase domain-containing protein n=1 Tax=Arthrobacter terrae TaxID=2935737 RepID=A0A931G4E4_9MICC|nr:transglycosylase domain-containing protein [Arthrobacter terrae]MBG0738718.1 transglycosylase domain-containing protein [Arthrobacter terrae]
MRRARTEMGGIEQLLESSMHEDQSIARPFAVRLAGFIATVLLVSLTGLLAAPVGMLAAGGIGTAVDYWDKLPSEIPLDVALPQHTVLLDKNGKEFARFFSENRIDVKLADVSPTFTDALLATEDARFYTNGPIDLVGTVRATINNARSDQAQGASGITQQLVKNLLVAQSGETALPSRDLGTKLQELKYAAGLEKKLSKDQILEMYSNTVYFGNGAYGIQAAAKVYFDTTAKDLTRTQGATLAGILKGPSLYEPFTNPDGALARRDTALSRLRTTGKITEAEATAAAAEPLGIKKGVLVNGCASSTYPYYCSLVRDEILSDPAFGATAEARAEKLSLGGMTLTTALDPAAMNTTQNAVTNALGNDNRAALATAVIKPGTGQIAAIAQNRTWGDGPGQTEIVYAKSPFQVGSSMKPITLATALEQGIPATTRLNANSPYTSPTLDSPPGGFINYGNYSWGTVDARRAIQLSLNIYFIRLIERTGVLPVADMAARLGITSLPRTGPNAIKGQEASLTLGAYEISPLEMANAYAVFAGDGVACRPVAVTSGIRADTGAKITTPDPDCHQAIAPAVAHTVADILKMPFTGPDGTLFQMGGLPGREAGAKTGTTNDYAANWIVGLVPQYVTAVWLGDPRGGSQYPLNMVHAYGRDFYNLTGSEVASPVWKEIMTQLTAGLPVIPLPKADDVATSSSTARTIPDVRGLSVSEAETLLLQNNLTPDIAERTADPNPLLAKDIVVAQTPAAGSTFSYREKVSITLSQGSDTTIKLPERK